MPAFPSAIRGMIVGCGLLLAGCASGSDLWVEIGGARYAVEIADDDAERARGLMFRDDMPAAHGMLFIHEREQPLAYWMKNTRIPDRKSDGAGKSVSVRVDLRGR